MLKISRWKRCSVSEQIHVGFFRSHRVLVKSSQNQTLAFIIMTADIGRVQFTQMKVKGVCEGLHASITSFGLFHSVSTVINCVGGLDRQCRHIPQMSRWQTSCSRGDLSMLLWRDPRSHLLQSLFCVRRTEAWESRPHRQSVAEKSLDSLHRMKHKTMTPSVSLILLFPFRHPESSRTHVPRTTLLTLMTHKKTSPDTKYCITGDYTLIVQVRFYSWLGVNRSCRLYDDFSLQTFLTRSSLEQCSVKRITEESDQFRFLRADCLPHLKGSVGLILPKGSPPSLQCMWRV
jgi:hypothetical protein